MKLPPFTIDVIQPQCTVVGPMATYLEKKSIEGREIPADQIILYFKIFQL